MKLISQERYEQLSSVLTKEELSMFQPIVSKKVEFNLSDSPSTICTSDIKEFIEEDVEDFPIFIGWNGHHGTIVTFKEKSDLENFIKVISTL